MASNPKKPGSEGNKSKMIPIRACLRLFLKHPVRVIMLMFTIYMHRSFPSAFLIFISASPVILCTVVLLAALLALGQKHAQRAKEDALKGFKYPSPIPHDSSQADSTATPEGHAGGGGASGTVGGGGSGGGSKDKFAELRKDIVEKEMKESGFLDGNNNDNNNNRDNNNVGMVGGSKGKVDHLMSAHNEKFPKVGLGKELNAENVGGKFNVMKKERTDEITDMSSLSYSSSSDSDLDSDHAPHKSSSMRDFIPSKLCDYHPLLGPEDRRVHGDHSEELDSSSSDSEDKQHSEGDKVKKEARKSIVRWTKEDEKNVENLGNLELERNKQLEKIIAKRKAQKNYSTNEESSIDLQNLNIPSQVAPISTMKTNPFNVSYPISHQQSDLPPMPDSASFFPRRNPNPFEDPEFPDKPDAVETTQDKAEFLSRHPSLQTKHKDQQDHEVNQREALFRRYQSFGVVGSSFYGFLWQQGNEESSDPSRPYFVPQKAPAGDDLGDGTIRKDPSLSSDSSESSSYGMHDHVLAAVYSSSDHGEPVSDSSTEVSVNDDHQHETRTKNVDRSSSSSSSSSSSESEGDGKPKKEHRKNKE